MITASLNSLGVAYITAATLCLALIVPIGAQNAYVLQRAARGNRTTVIAVVAAVVFSNTLLTFVGGFGTAQLLEEAPFARGCLFVAGTIFVLYLGWRTLRDLSDGHTAQTEAIGSLDRGPERSTMKNVGGALGVSLLNPHAIIDTVVIMGGAITAFAGADRAAFFAGVVSAELLWFILIVVATGVLVRWQGASAQRRIDQFSGGVLVIVGVWLAWSALQTFSSL